ncbi:MAG: amino acid adenylation domain-containing protein, partial [Verrucomicrobiota bacterium]
TVERIRATGPSARIWEIGCGTGLLLSRLLPDCEAYFGTDFSENALTYIAEHSQGWGEDLTRLELSLREADDFSHLPEEPFDTAILNSVIQYFPSRDYLARVLRGVIERLEPGGACFIGDVRHAGLLPTYYTDVALSRAEPDTSLDRIREEVRLCETREAELCLEPDFFIQLAHTIPELQRIDILPKPGSCENELTKFRYDVLLVRNTSGEAGEVEVYNELSSDRIRRERAALEILQAAREGQTVSDLQRRLEEEDPSDYPREKRVVDLFREQAVARPDAPAFVFGDRQLCYAELDRQAGQMAAILRDRGVQPGDLVGLFLERSPEMMVALLGIMEAGAAYLPLDPFYPADRVAYMLEDAGISWVVSKKKTASRLPPETGVEVLWVEDLESMPDPERPEPGEHGDDLAYVIYTSGSTGRPKGVAIEHHSLTNFIISMADELHFTAEDRLLAVTTICFDISALELYLPLVTGGCVEVSTEDLARDGLRLREKLEADDAITFMQATPATWEMLLTAGWEADRPGAILCGGEALSPELAQRLAGNGSRLWNLYGPTETTIWSTMIEIHPGDDVTIGRPIANTQCHILDEDRRTVPEGELGELYIGGDGVARGYLGRPEETAKKFV